MPTRSGSRNSKKRSRSARDASTVTAARASAGRPTPGDEPMTGSERCKNPKADVNFDSCGEEIFMVRCAVCHGTEGQGKEDEPYHQGMALWQGDVRHLSEDQHLTTVMNGRRFQFMPAFAEAPAQGIAIPPYPLTNAQIRAVVAYERSL